MSFNEEIALQYVKDEVDKDLVDFIALLTIENFSDQEIKHMVSLHRKALIRGASIGIKAITATEGRTS